MGLRGPGAKPVKSTPAKPRRRPKWTRKGLTRSERVIAYVESLKLTSGRWAGKPFRLRDWQKDAIRRIYEPATAKRTRRVRTALITMGRKNGKTQTAAALALCHLCGPESEPRGEVYSAASDRNQAARVFREMEAFVLADEALAARINVQRFAKKLEVLSGDGAGSTYEALSSDARKAHSLSPSFVVCDELAQWPNRELYDNLITGTGARAEPLVVVISTQTPDTRHVMSELTHYGSQINAGVIDDPSFAAIIYAVPMEADPWDEANWKLANPALGDFLSLEQMRIAAERAQRMPAAEAAFRNLHLNQQVESETRFLNSTDWEACSAPVDAEDMRGRKCWGGLDLASTTDLTAFVLVFPDDSGCYDVLAWFWVPNDRLRDRADRDRVPYPQWRDQGLLEAPAGRALDKRFVARKLIELAGRYDIAGIGYDRWRIEDLKVLLAEEGASLPLKDFGQGYRDMGPAVDALETAVLRRKLRHSHPILTWCASNAVTTADPAGARKLAKDRSLERIDGLVALAMAIGLHQREPKPEPFDVARAFAMITA